MPPDSPLPSPPAGTGHPTPSNALPATAFAAGWRPLTAAEEAEAEERYGERWIPVDDARPTGGSC